MSLEILKLSSRQPDFDELLAKRTAWDEAGVDSLEVWVSEAIEKVRAQGDEALLDFTRELDRWEVSEASGLEVGEEEIEQAIAACASEELEALKTAAERIEEYHSHQLQESWSYRDELGNLLGQQVSSIEKVGLYVPGGKASYPSSVLMNAIPAKVAGVEHMTMVTPTPGGEYNPLVFAAARIAGVDRIFRVGGAQAIAALALGTQTIPKVDKIVGPGNSYVAAAKRQLFGRVGIDMVAGPSEIMVIADGSADPEWVAMDLLSQAEHDEVAQAILITPDANYLEQVAGQLDTLLGSLERESVARISLKNRGLLIESRDIADAVEISNRLAPEHLELAVEDAESWLPKIKNAGAIFLGAYSPEAVGDYSAGPSHVLPTSATARFSSPLGVYDFQKRSSVIGCSQEGASSLAKVASTLARSESLTAHARSAEYRIKELND